MKCKFCFAEFEEELAVCPACGKAQEETPENEQPAVEAVEEEVTEEIAEAEETASEEVPAEKPKKKPKLWQLILAIAGGVVLLAVLVGAVLYGLGVNILPRENNLYYKDSYTAETEKVGRKTDAVIATLGNQELTVGDLQIYYRLNVSSFLNAYGEYLQYMGYDSSKPLDEQIWDPNTGMTYQQMILKNALDEWLRYATLVQMSEDNGFVLSEDDQNYLDSFSTDLEQLAADAGYEDTDLYVSENLSPGSTTEAYIKYGQLSYIAMTYYNSIYESMIPTDEEAAAYFAEHEDEMTAQGFGKDMGSYYYVRHILLGVEGGSVGDDGVTVYTDAEWEACRTKAQDLLDEFLAGEATEEAFALLAAEHSEDPGSSSNGGLYEQLTESTNFVQEFKDWYLDESRKVGDTGLVKSSYGYHIMYFSASEPIWQFETKATMLGDNTVEMLAEVQEKWPVEINYKKIILSQV